MTTHERFRTLNHQSIIRRSRKARCSEISNSWDKNKKEFLKVTQDLIFFLNTKNHLRTENVKSAQRIKSFTFRENLSAHLAVQTLFFLYEYTHTHTHHDATPRKCHLLNAYICSLNGCTHYIQISSGNLVTPFWASRTPTWETSSFFTCGLQPCSVTLCFHLSRVSRWRSSLMTKIRSHESSGRQSYWVFVYLFLFYYLWSYW